MLEFEVSVSVTWSKLPRVLLNVLFSEPQLTQMTLSGVEQVCLGPGSTAPLTLVVLHEDFEFGSVKVE